MTLNLHIIIKSIPVATSAANLFHRSVPSLQIGTKRRTSILKYTNMVSATIKIIIILRFTSSVELDTLTKEREYARLKLLRT